MRKIISFFIIVGSVLNTAYAQEAAPEFKIQEPYDENWLHAKLIQAPNKPAIIDLGNKAFSIQYKVSEMFPFSLPAKMVLHCDDKEVKSDCEFKGPIRTYKKHFLWTKHPNAKLIGTSIIEVPKDADADDKFGEMKFIPELMDNQHVKLACKTPNFFRSVIDKNSEVNVFQSVSQSNNQNPFTRVDEPRFETPTSHTQKIKALNANELSIANAFESIEIVGTSFIRKDDNSVCELQSEFGVDVSVLAELLQKPTEEAYKTMKVMSVSGTDHILAQTFIKEEINDSRSGSASNKNLDERAYARLQAVVSAPSGLGFAILLGLVSPSYTNDNGRVLYELSPQFQSKDNIGRTEP